MIDVVTGAWLELAGGRLLVTKQRRPHGRGVAAGDDRLRRARLATEAEARWLVAARHRGVVSLRRVTGDGTRLSTDHAGVVTLRVLHRHPLPMLARILAAVSATVGDLHRERLVHGNLTLDHVILTGPDLARPVLCSPAPALDADGGPERDPASDVSAIGALATSVIRLAGTTDPAWLEVIDRLNDRRAPPTAALACDLFGSLARRRRSTRERVARRLLGTGGVGPVVRAQAGRG